MRRCVTDGMVGNSLNSTSSNNWWSTSLGALKKVGVELILWSGMELIWVFG
jgi:hypothetical protein